MGTPDAAEPAAIAGTAATLRGPGATAARLVPWLRGVLAHGDPAVTAMAAVAVHVLSAPIRVAGAGTDGQEPVHSRSNTRVSHPSVTSPARPRA